MDLLLLPNEMILEICCARAISISDLCTLMLTCKRVYLLIKGTNQLWRMKLFEAWPSCQLKIEERFKPIWYERTILGMQGVQFGKRLIRNMPYMCYPRNQIPSSVVSDLLVGEFPFQQSLSHTLQKSAENENSSLTTRFYATMLLYKMRARLAENRLRIYLGPRIRSKSSLLKIAIQFSLWFKMEHPQQPCLKSVASTIDIMTGQVRDIVMARPRPNTCDSLQEFERSKDLINLISHVLFEDLGFGVEHLSAEMLLDEFYAIDEVLLRKRGPPIIIALIFKEIASSFGIDFQIILYGELRTAELMQREVLLRWKPFPMHGKLDDVFFVNVNDGGVLVSDRHYPIAVNLASSSTQEVAEQAMQEMLARARTPGAFRNFTNAGDANNTRLLYRLAHVISPKDADIAKKYAKKCLELGLDFDDAIKTLQRSNVLNNPLERDCISRLWKENAEFRTESEPRQRNQMVKFAVGMMMFYKPVAEYMPSRPCAIVSWSYNSTSSEKWKNIAAVNSTEHQGVYYKVIVKHPPVGCFGLHVTQDRLEIHPDPGQAYQELERKFELGGFFDNFDGHRFVPNAVLSSRYPDDNAVSLALVP